MRYDSVMAEVRGFRKNYPSGYGAPPSDRVVERVRALTSELAGRGVEPARVVPMACGGVALEFKGAAKDARVEVMNDDETTVYLKYPPDPDWLYMGEFLKENVPSRPKLVDVLVGVLK